MSFTSARKDLFLIAGGKAISFFGDEVAAVALVLRLQGHGSGPKAVAALLMAAMLPLVLLAGPVGRLVDRSDSRRLLVVSSLGQAAICTVLATTNSTGAILGLVAVLGIGQSVNGATWQSLLPAIAEQDELPRVIGFTQTCTTIASIAAPAVGGLLSGAFGTHVPLLVDAGTFLAVTAAGLLLTVRRHLHAAGDETAPARGGFRIVRTDPLLRVVFVLFALFILLGSMVNVVDVFLVRGTLHASATWYGVAGAAFGAGLLTGAAFGGRTRGTLSLARLFAGGASLLAIGLIALGTVPSVAWVFPASYAAGAGNGMLNVALGSLVMGRATPSERGRVAATVGGVAAGTQLTAFAASALLAVVLTPREIFMLSGTFALIVTAALWRPLVREAGAGSTSAEQRADETPVPAY